ncbi:MAG: class I SAM-dependent methyltransferase [Syntrophobacteraceae bacterium]
MKIPTNKTTVSIFDPIADAYDDWYDTPAGSAIFRKEFECLRFLYNEYHGRWLEIGVGTGRFAEALGITHGIDLSPPMAVKAVRRGVRVCVGRAEELPFPEQVCDGILMALTYVFSKIRRRRFRNPPAFYGKTASWSSEPFRLIVLGAEPISAKGMRGIPCMRMHGFVE